MSDRTPRQCQADDLLDAAIRRVANMGADADAEARDLVTDWLVVYAAVRADSDDQTVYGLAFPNGQLQTYRAVGLLDVARCQLEREDD